MQVILDQTLVVLLAFLFILSIPFEKTGDAFLNIKHLFSMILFNLFFIPISIGLAFIFFHQFIRENGIEQLPREFFMPVIAVGIFQFLSVKNKMGSSNNNINNEKSNSTSIEGISVVSNLLILLILISYPFWQSLINISFYSLDNSNFGYLTYYPFIDINLTNYWQFLSFPFVLAITTRLILKKKIASVLQKPRIKIYFNILLFAVVLALVFHISRTLKINFMLFSNEYYGTFSFFNYLVKIISALTIFIIFRSVFIFLYLKRISKKNQNLLVQAGSFQLSVFAPIYIAALTYHGSYAPFNWILLAFSCLIPLHMASNWLINYLLRKSYYYNTPKQEI